MLLVGGLSVALLLAVDGMVGEIIVITLLQWRRQRTITETKIQKKTIMKLIIGE